MPAIVLMMNTELGLRLGYVLGLAVEGTEVGLMLEVSDGGTSKRRYK